MELPKVFVSPINKEINNVQKEFREVKELNESQEPNLNIKINNLFNDRSFVYKKRVLLTTKNGKVEKIIVGKTNDSLLTMNNEKIKINDIYDLKLI
jgi:hypothetical protein